MSTMVDEKGKPAAQSFLATNIKGLCADLIELMEERNASLRRKTRYAQATPAEAKLFATLRGGERSLSDLARVIGVSRQAVHRTAHRLASSGVVRVVGSEGDKREKIVQITAKGRAVQKMAAANLEAVEADLAEAVGREEVESLRHLLEEAVAAMRALEASQDEGLE